MGGFFDMRINLKGKTFMAATEGKWKGDICRDSLLIADYPLIIYFF
jgi:hypothetical protein